LLLELNARPGLTIQVANDEGLLPRLRHIEGLEEVHVSVDERVDYVMQRFAKHRAPVSTLWEEPAAQPQAAGTS
jgi:hypothetical protein